MVKEITRTRYIAMRRNRSQVWGYAHGRNGWIDWPGVGEKVVKTHRSPGAALKLVPKEDPVEAVEVTEIIKIVEGKNG